MTNRRVAQGFTLIELLIVVTIISILATMAMSALVMVRDMARATRCTVKLHELAQVETVFIQDNNGRFPGYGQQATFDASGTMTWSASVSWLDILNLEVISPYQEKSMTRIGLATSATKSTLSCDAFTASQGLYATLWRRSYGINPNTTNGPTLDIPAQKNSGGVKYYKYSYGAKQVRFVSPSSKVLLNEIEQSRDSCGAAAPYGRFVLTTVDPGGNPLSQNAANGGWFAFRHHGAGNFLFVDLHVERIPLIRGEINQPANYGLN